MIGYSEAIDEMFTMFNAAWNANTTAIVGYVPEVRWPGVKEPTSLDLTKFWARVSQQTVTEEQSTVSTDENSKRRYEFAGLIFVQIFCPTGLATAMENGRKLGEIARNAFRGKQSPSNVWFRNGRIQELSPEPEWYRFNVVTEYEHDEKA